MHVEIFAEPAAAAAQVTLGIHETLTAEVGAMISMSEGIEINTTSQPQKRGSGGIWRGLRRLLSGESFFLNHFSATENDQTVCIGPKLMGDIHQHRLQNETLVVQGSSWLASSSGIDIDTTWAGLSNGLLAGEGLFWVRCTGEGLLLLNSFGAIFKVEVDGSHQVDTGHIVAYTPSLDFSVGKASSSWIGSFLGKEGLVAKFRGQGSVWCQTHHPQAFGKLLGPRLLPKQS